MKIDFKSVERFIKAPDPAARAILVFGADDGLVRERAAALARTIVPDLGDPFRVAEFSGDVLASDPAKLADEAAALAFGGGRRVVRVRGCGNAAAPAFKSFLDAPMGDALVVAVAQLAPDGTVQFGVAAPDVGTGLKEVTAVEYGDHVLWNWALPASQLGASGQTFNISIANSSGAARLFHHLRKIVNQAKVSFGKSGLSLVLWANPGTSWTCGACFWDGFVAQVGAAKFASQIWLSWTTQDQEVWADSVVAHEIGHWVMRSYGTSPGEGGKHYVGVPTFPGQAWSEGWATWFSSAARGSTLYADKQSGLFFWFDIGQKAYYDGKTFPPASASGGILQNMDENLVSATLWQMTTKVGGELPFASAANAPFWKALTTPRMNVAPYARGYTQHTWQTSYPGQFTNVYDTGKPAPMLADFLDALACGLMDASKIQPAVANYPYSAAQPKCNVGGVP